MIILDLHQDPLVLVGLQSEMGRRRQHALYRGELFIHDSDMESDIGTTWYRPTMVFHVPAGAEFGWRSGWAST